MKGNIEYLSANIDFRHLTMVERGSGVASFFGHYTLSAHAGRTLVTP